jgi:hypothetical protein
VLPLIANASLGLGAQVAVNRCGTGPHPDLPSVLNGVFDFFAGARRQRSGIAGRLRVSL